MKLVCISDTHKYFDTDKVPSGDLLIHAGDGTWRGTIPEIIEFNQLLGKLKPKFKYGIVFVPGNHDWLFERDQGLARELLSNATVLIDELIEIEGIKFYGSPYQPTFYNWAFNLNRGPDLKRKWDLIPDCHVLITHSPPRGYGDNTPSGERVGCDDLRDAVKRVKPKYHIFGHIHNGYGQYQDEDVTYINASMSDEKYRNINNPIVFDI